MTAAPIRAEIVTEKIAFVRRMVEAIRLLPLTSYGDFAADSRNAAAGDSYLRRALEALFDLGRHILAKGFARVPIENSKDSLVIFLPTPPCKTLILKT